MKYVIDYSVDGLVPEIAQPTGSTCWAAVATMMLSWKNQASFSIETAMEKLGSDFLQMFKNNESLMPDRNDDFAAASGLIMEYPRCETPDSILQLLQNFGPLLIIDDEDPSSPAFIRHARIITAIYGDGDASNTFLTIKNPDGGIIEDELFADFVAKYEALAADERYKVQMMHY